MWWNDRATHLAARQTKRRIPWIGLQAENRSVLDSDFVHLLPFGDDRSQGKVQFAHAAAMNSLKGAPDFLGCQYGVEPHSPSTSFLCGLGAGILH